MPATAAIILFGLVLAVVYLVIRPFIAPAEDEAEEIISPELETQKNRVIDAIREIDMDYQTGKLSEEDYALLRSRYTAAAAEILRRMDDEGDDESAAEATPIGSEAIEAAAPSLDDEIEKQIAERKAAIENSALTKDTR